mgnify:FL=1
MIKGLNIKVLEVDEIVEMSQKMREMDRLEYRLMSNGAPIFDGLCHMQERSDQSFAAYVDGELLCCYGRIRGTALTNEACPWLVATDLVMTPRGRRVFLEAGPPLIAELIKGFSRCWNMVYEQNTVAIRWLKWVGFEFNAPPVNVRGYKFLPFEIRKAS